MFPWFLCLLSATTDDGTKISKGFQTQPSVWWSPIESPRYLTGFNIQEGDILIPDSGDSNLKNAIKNRKFLWENGLVPYEFGKDFNERTFCDYLRKTHNLSGNFTMLQTDMGFSEKSQVWDAMKVIEANTCIKFAQKENQETFIRFQKEKNGCYATIGRLAGNGALPVNLQSPECLRERGIIEHELLHVAGLFHEQSRPDRDEFVTIHWCNIEPQRESDFRKGTFLEMSTFNLPYDYASIMHYPKWAFSRNGKPTITAKGNPNMTLGQRISPSATDFEKVIQMYECELKENNGPREDSAEK